MTFRAAETECKYVSNELRMSKPQDFQKGLGRTNVQEPLEHVLDIHRTPVLSHVFNLHVSIDKIDQEFDVNVMGTAGYSVFDIENAVYRRQWPVNADEKVVQCALNPSRDAWHDKAVGQFPGADKLDR